MTNSNNNNSSLQLVTMTQPKTNNKYITYRKKSEMYDNAIVGDVCVAMDGAAGKKYKVFAHVPSNELASFCETDHHAYEIIRKDKPRYPYFDVESKDYDDDDYEKCLAYVKSSYANFLIENELPQVDESDWVVLQSHKPGKMSYHLLDRSRVLNNLSDTKLYFDNFRVFLNNRQEIDGYDVAENIIDWGVYDTDRMIRMVGQSKWESAKNPVLKIVGFKYTPNQTFITKIRPQDETVIIPASFKIKTKPKTQPQPTQTQSQPTSSSSKLDKDTEGAFRNTSSARWDDRHTWMDAVFCAVHLGASTEFIHEMSKRSSKYDPVMVDCMVNQYDSEKSPYTRKTVAAWAFEDTGYEAERVLERLQPKQKTEEPLYHYIAFTKEFQGKEITVQMEPRFYEKLSLCVCYVSGGRGKFFVTMDQESPNVMMDTLPLCPILIPQGEGKNPRETSLELFIKKNSHKFPMYSKIVFKPNPADVKKYNFNLWAGFQAKEVPGEVDMNIVNPMLDHIREVWSNNDAELFAYIMSWLASIIQKPWEKTQVLITLYSKQQGSGKSLPISLIRSWIIGTDHSVCVQGLDNLTGRFNGTLQGKILTQADETSDRGDGNYAASYDKLKSLITDPQIQIEHKGLEPFTIDNYNNMICTTNNVDSLKVEKYDRRTLPIEVSPCRCGDYDYFDNLRKVSDNQEWGNQMYSYLLRYPKEKFVDPRVRPVTDLMKRMKRMSMSSPSLFIENIEEYVDDLEGDLHEEGADDPDEKQLKRRRARIFDWVGSNGKRAIRSSSFYGVYVDWCRENGIKGQMKKLKFLDDIKDDVIMGKSRHNGQQSKYYQIVKKE
jgi:hypothetical protein